jgi:hypothetical protein
VKKAQEAAQETASKDPQRAPECEKICEALQQEVDSLNDTLKHKGADDRITQAYDLEAELKAMKAQLQACPRNHHLAKLMMRTGEDQESNY